MPPFLKDYETCLQIVEGRHRLALNLYADMNRVRFVVYDTQDRRRNFATPSNAIFESCGVEPPNLGNSSSIAANPCVACGESTENCITIDCVKCRKPIHIACADFFYKFFSKVVEYDETHQCKNLDIYIVKSGNDNLEDVTNINQAKKLIRKRTNDVCTKKRKRDIVNDIVPCRFCGEEIDLHESNHVLRCTAAPGTPLGRKIVPGSKNLAHKLFKMKRGAKFK